MVKKISFLLSLLPTTIYIFGQTSTFHDEITQVFPFPNTAVTLMPSWIKDRETLNIQYLKSLNADQLLHNFRVNAGLPSSAMPLEGCEAPNIGIRGHFVGHYLSAVSEVVEKYSDTLLSNRLNYMTTRKEIWVCVGPLLYLS